MPGQPSLTRCWLLGVHFLPSLLIAKPWSATVPSSRICSAGCVARGVSITYRTCWFWHDHCAAHHSLCRAPRFCKFHKSVRRFFILLVCRDLFDEGKCQFILLPYPFQGFLRIHIFQPVVGIRRGCRGELSAAHGWDGSISQFHIASFWICLYLSNCNTK